MLKFALLSKAALITALFLPTLAQAHSLDICAPQVTIFDPAHPPEDVSPHSLIAQAALFLDRVSPGELRDAIDDVPSGTAVGATYLFNGQDTRWRLKSPLSKRERASASAAVGLAEQKHFLVPFEPTKPYGTIVVSGTEYAKDTLVNPSMISHLADGRAIVVEPGNLDADCTLDLKNIESAFLEGIAHHFDHH